MNTQEKLTRMLGYLEKELKPLVNEAVFANAKILIELAVVQFPEAGENMLNKISLPFTEHVKDGELLISVDNDDFIREMTCHQDGSVTYYQYQRSIKASWGEIVPKELVAKAMKKHFNRKRLPRKEGERELCTQDLN